MFNIFLIKKFLSFLKVFLKCFSKVLGVILNDIQVTSAHKNGLKWTQGFPSFRHAQGSPPGF